MCVCSRMSYHVRYMTRVSSVVVWSFQLLMLRDSFFFQAEDGIRDLVRSRGLGDVYKRQAPFGAGGRVRAVDFDDDGSPCAITFGILRGVTDRLSLIHI